MPVGRKRDGLPREPNDGLMRRTHHRARYRDIHHDRARSGRRWEHPTRGATADDDWHPLTTSTDRTASTFPALAARRWSTRTWIPSSTRVPTARPMGLRELTMATCAHRAEPRRCERWRGSPKPSRPPLVTASRRPANASPTSDHRTEGAEAHCRYRPARATASTMWSPVAADHSTGRVIGTPTTAPAILSPRRSRQTGSTSSTDVPPFH